MQDDLALFSSDEEALTSAVQHSGGAKRVAAKLWADMSADAAQRKLLDALNPLRSERLKPSQVRFILSEARQAGYHAAAQWFMGEAGYEVKVINPVALEDRAVAAVDKAATALTLAVAELSRARAGRPASA